ncbi:hypothetical protein D3C85_1856990 [compost metagenome]
MTMLKWIGDKTKYVDVDCPDDMREELEEYEESKALPTPSPADAFDGIVKDNVEPDGLDF